MAKQKSLAQGEECQPRPFARSGGGLRLPAAQGALGGGLCGGVKQGSLRQKAIGRHDRRLTRGQPLQGG